MNIIDVTANLNEIDFSPANTEQEILQNVRTILTTAKYSVPLDRDFGLDMSVIDTPANLVQAKLNTEIIAAIETYEPRVKVKSIKYNNDNMEGIIRPTVKVAIL